MAEVTSEQEVLQKVAQAAIEGYQSRTSGPLVAMPIEYSDPKGNRLDISRYSYKPFPKMVYRADGQTRIVKDQAEFDALPPGWGEEPIKKRIWDTRQPESGFQIGEHHLKFLNANDFNLGSIEEAKAWFAGLQEDAKEAFLVDAEAWMPPKRGRPPKDQ